MTWMHQLPAPLAGSLDALGLVVCVLLAFVVVGIVQSAIDAVVVMLRAQNMNHRTGVAPHQMGGHRGAEDAAPVANEVRGRG